MPVVDVVGDVVATAGHAIAGDYKAATVSGAAILNPVAGFGKADDVVEAVVDVNKARRKAAKAEVPAGSGGGGAA